jgi:P4 family phage/plasmid primase-like protien
MLAVPEEKENSKKLLKNILVKTEEFKRDPKKKGKACFTRAYKLFGYYDNWEVALSVINKLPPSERVYNELILPESMVKPFFDVEWIAHDYPDYIPERVLLDIKENLIDIILETWNIKITDADFYVKSCHRNTNKGYKYSFHFIISTKNSIVFKNNSYNSFLAKELISRIPFDKSIIDLSVYSNYRNLRLLGHCKETEPNEPFKQVYIDKTDLKQYCVTYITPKYKILDCPEQESVTDDYDVPGSPVTPAQITSILILLKELHPTVYYTKRIDDNNYINFNYTDRKEPCFYSKRLHDHIGFFCYIDSEMNIRAGCFSENCKGIPRTIYVGNLLEKKLEEQPTFNAVTYDEKIILSKANVEREIQNSALGMSNLFIEHYRSRIKWIDNITYYWSGKLWQEDSYLFIHRLISVKFPEALRMFLKNSKTPSPDTETGVTEYLNETDDSIEKQCCKMISQLNGGTINNNIINFIRPLIMDSNFAKIKNIHPRRLSCLNGMVNLKDGTITPAVPEDNITRTLELEYNPQEFGEGTVNFERFDQFIIDITRGADGQVSQEMYEYMKWILGYSLQGEPKQKKFFIFWGPEGYNGKSILLNTISSVLEDYAVTMDKSVVLQGPKKTSGSHSTELVRLETCRVGILSDTGEDCALDDGQVKQLTSITDMISVREIYGKQKEFKPTFVPIIATNYKIRVNLKDPAMYERIVLFPFLTRFIDSPDPNKANERKGNPDLANDFSDPKFKASILCWLVSASIYYNQNQIKRVPQVIIDAKMEYRKQMDIFREFLDIYYTVADSYTKLEELRKNKIKKSDLQEEFLNYCVNQGVKVNLGKIEKEFNGLLSNEKINSVGYYLGVTPKDPE